MFSPGWESRLQALLNLLYTLFPTVQWFLHYGVHILNVHGPTLPLKQEEQWVTWLVWVPTGEGWTLFDSMTTSKRSSSWNVFVWYRELGLKKVEKCLQTRLSTRAEHSGKRDVQLRILFVPMGKEHCLHTRMFLWFLKRNRPWDKTDSKLIRKFPKTKS